MEVNFKPLLNRVLIKSDVVEETTVSGIIIPTAAKQKPQTGTVASVGSTTTAKVGDRVFFPHGGGSEINIDGSAYLILKESDILGIYGRE